MTDTQEAMLKVFKRIHGKEFPLTFKPNSYESGFDLGYQAATAQSAEKIARLEAENASLGAQIDRLNDQCDDWKEKLAAAELRERQLRDVLHESITTGILHYPEGEEYSKKVHAILAQQPSTEALDAYVEKETADLREFAIWLTGCGYDFTVHPYFIEMRNLLSKHPSAKSRNAYLVREVEKVKAELESQEKLIRILKGAMSVSVTDEMINRFLTWKFPKGFCPDAGINFTSTVGYDSPHWPTGTNLFTAEQAREMLEHILADEIPPLPPAPKE